ncbi:hypothetical protein BDZ97DRAFT_1834305 [Flammula alnicola]|nr:hypothetical protein BDZ97DRAFT_1834305 [Flammula alnicola]
MPVTSTHNGKLAALLYFAATLSFVPTQVDGSPCTLDLDLSLMFPEGINVAHNIDFASPTCFWSGTAPFCAGECGAGYVATKKDKCGDGLCCWTGTKVHCCPLPRGPAPPGGPGKEPSEGDDESKSGVGREAGIDHIGDWDEVLEPVLWAQN